MSEVSVNGVFDSEQQPAGLTVATVSSGSQEVPSGDLTQEKLAPLQDEDDEEDEVVEMVQLSAKWNGTTFKLTLPVTCTVGQLKLRMSELTNVLEKRQKLVGLVKGKLPNDDDCLGLLNLGPDKSFIMMGTPEKDIVKDPAEVDVPDVSFLLSTFDLAWSWS